MIEEFLADEAATLAAGARWAKSLQPPASIALVGELGAGKTTFVRGLLRALGVSGAVKSPSYALVESYDTAIGPVHHLDCYRLRDAEEFIERGGEMYFREPSLRLVEWPERIADHIAFDWIVHLQAEDEGRRLRIFPVRDSPGFAAQLVQART